MKKVRSDTTLVFQKADSLRPAQARRYWLKLAVRNSSRYAQAAQLTVLPDLDNTLIYFDEDARAWRTRRAGVAVPTDSQRLKGLLPLWLPGHATTTFYVLVNLGQQAPLPSAVRLLVSLETAVAAQKLHFFCSIAWAVSLAVLELLLLTNLLAYFRFRDRITLYYLCTQVGAMLYVTAYRGFFKVLWPSPIFSLLLPPAGTSHAYTLSNVLMHLSVVLMLGGFVQMTRSYLTTPARLPRFDAALRATGLYRAHGRGSATQREWLLPRKLYPASRQPAGVRRDGAAAGHGGGGLSATAATGPHLLAGQCAADGLHSLSGPVSRSTQLRQQRQFATARSGHRFLRARLFGRHQRAPSAFAANPAHQRTGSRLPGPRYPAKRVASPRNRAQEQPHPNCAAGDAAAAAGPRRARPAVEQGPPAAASHQPRLAAAARSQPARTGLYLALRAAKKRSASRPQAAVARAAPAGPVRTGPGASRRAIAAASQPVPR
ncbi:hypothetical protein GO988_00290 [Hymenobacter sp. HMF4947]|uniref:7TM-DISM receptor extracellular domain-containing protein n=1 Tax=Hymenobacter ginkgonis TaxID=2682976 RepID=A0A7K1T8M4_9BACT|nr:hypothetical protein [Hymenobacter ginkgonis]